MKSARELVLALSNPDLKISLIITEDFIGCKRFASSFTTQQSEGSITEDFIGCKRFASSFFPPAIVRQFSENPRSSSRSTEIQGLG